jgi:hypothetical protein
MFKIPKSLRRTKFDRLFSIEMNDFDVERLLPTLFNLVVTRGRNRTSGSNESKSIDQFVGVLSHNPNVKGFENDQELLARWVRAVSLTVGKAGRGKTREKIEFVTPNTLLTYKTGLPKPSSRQRNVPRFLYHAMCNAGLEGSSNERRLNLQLWLRDVFGAGIHMQETPQYDGVTDVDIHTLLTLRLLEEFDTGAISNQDLREPTACLPQQARQMGENILLLLRGYRDLLPANFIGRMLMATINLDLLTYTQRLMSNVASLCRTGKMPAEGSSFPETYLDVTGDRTSQSDSLARLCVERDLEATGKHFEHNLRLFTLDRMRELSETLQELIPCSDNAPVGKYLESLIDAEDSEPIRVRAEVELEAILRESQTEIAGAAEQQQIRDDLREVISQGSTIEALARILCDAQRNQGVQNYTKWYKGVGGLNRPYGLLLGNTQGPRNWRYTLTDELLRTLVYLNAVDRHRGNINEARPVSSIRLDEFLVWMRERFGIVIDRPPHGMDSTSSRAAAAENFNAFKLRLRQTGFFRGLSDDFNVQNLTVALAAGNNEGSNT